MPVILNSVTSSNQAADEGAPEHPLNVDERHPDESAGTTSFRYFLFVLTHDSELHVIRIQLR